MGYASAMSGVSFLVIAVVTVINARLLQYDIGNQSAGRSLV